MKVYALKAFTGDGEILLAIYKHEQHAQRHADKLENDEKLCDLRRVYGIKGLCPRFPT